MPAIYNLQSQLVGGDESSEPKGHSPEAFGCAPGFQRTELCQCAIPMAHPKTQ